MPTPNPVTKAVTTAAKKLGLKWERTYRHQLKDGSWRIKLFSCTKLPTNKREGSLEMNHELWLSGCSFICVIKMEEVHGINGEFSYNIYLAEG